MTYQLTTLPGGLRVATEYLAGLESVTVAVSVDVGARYENENEGGLSHMLEHMAFKGTKRRSARDIAEEMDMVGGHMNAYTSMETTVYYTRVLKNNVPLAVDILADILQNSVFDPEELEREREVILQEIAMHNDTPDDLVFDHFNAICYPDQPLGRSILGRPEQVSAYQREDLKQYITRHYHASSMVVTAAGNIDHDAFARQVQDYFGDLPAAPKTSAPQARYHGGEKRTKRKLEQLHIMLGLEGVSFHAENYYSWQVLSTILGGGMSSRLFQEVREKRGLAYSVQSFLSPNSDGGVFGIYAATSQEKAQEMIAVLCDQMKAIHSGVTSSELVRAKNQIKASLLMSRESSSSISEWIGRHLLCYGRYKTASEIIALIDNITQQDIIQAAEKFLSTLNLTFTTLGPQQKLPEYEKIKRQLQAG